MEAASFCGKVQRSRKRYSGQREHGSNKKSHSFQNGFFIYIHFRLEFESFSVGFCQIDFSKTDRFWRHLNVFIFLNVF